MWKFSNTHRNHKFEFITLLNPGEGLKVVRTNIELKLEVLCNGEGARMEDNKKIINCKMGKVLCFL